MTDSSVTFGRLLRRNIRRRPYRNITTILCFAFVAASILSARYLISGTTNSLNVGISRMGADLIVVPANSTAADEAAVLTGQPTTFFFNDNPVPEIMRVPGVAAVSPQLYIATLRASCCAYPVQLIGFNPGQDFIITPWLQTNLGGSLKQNGVIVGSAIVGDVGSQVRFYGQNFTIAGKLAPTGMGLDKTVFMRLQDVYTMAAESNKTAVEPLNLQPGQISVVLVRVAPGYNIAGVAAVIESMVSGTQVIQSSGLVNTVANQISATTQLLYITAASVTLVSLPLIALVSSMVINERKREIGILRAMGGTKRFILKLFFAEAITLALIGGIIGVLASFFLMYSFQNLIALNLQIPFLWPSISQTLSEVGMVLVLVAGAVTLAALYPAVKNSQIEPYDAIRSGES